MKITLIVDDLKDLDLTDKYKAIIVGLESFSVHSGINLNLEEIESLTKKYKDKDIFVSINKNIFNDEITQLEEALISLDKLNIKAVLFYDQALIYLKEKNNLSLELAWHQSHMVSNYKTAKFYQGKDINYAYLAPEITKEDIKEISEKTEMKLMANLFGRAIMSYSRRSLVSNYFKMTKANNASKNLEISDKRGDYVLEETEDGTAFYSKEIINHSALLNLNLDYLIIRKSGIADKDFINLIDLSLKYFETKEEKILKELEDLSSSNTGFLFKKSIYKVGKNAEK